MSLPLIEIYSDIHCPWAYLANYRLRQIWPQYQGRVQLKWQALSLEYINNQSTPKDILDQEIELLQHQVEPALPIQLWSKPDWHWPVTFWPAFEALACVEAQGSEQAYEMSWALRYAFFQQSRNLSMRHELFAVAKEVARIVPLDLKKFEDDWDSGSYKVNVLRESQKGWHELRVKNSPTFVLPNGKQYSNPGVGEFHLDLEGGKPDYKPVNVNPATLYEQILEEAVSLSPNI